LLTATTETVSGNSSSHGWAAGCTVLAENVSESQAFGVEFLASFVVVFVVFACYEKTKNDQHSQAAPFVIGLVYTVAIIVAVSSRVLPKYTAPITK